jgi:hypothetical protein
MEASSNALRQVSMSMFSGHPASKAHGGVCHAGTPLTLPMTSDPPAGIGVNPSA